MMITTDEAKKDIVFEKRSKNITTVILITLSILAILSCSHYFHSRKNCSKEAEEIAFKFNDWDGYENTLDKNKIVQLDVYKWHSPQYLHRKGSYGTPIGWSLSIKDYPNLEILYANRCFLEKINIDNCPKLREVYLSNNKIKNCYDINIKNCPNLKTLDVKSNGIKIFICDEYPDDLNLIL